jgi:hypothetical protein
MIVLKKEKKMEDKSERFNNTDNAGENYLKQRFLPLSEAEIQGLFHPAEANLQYFLALFQSLQLPSK